MALFARREADRMASARLEDMQSVIDGLRDEIGELRRAALDRETWLEGKTARKILVHQKNDASIEGLLVRIYPDGLELRSAALLNSGSTPTPMAGEVFVPRDQVALVQFDG